MTELIMNCILATLLGAASLQDIRTKKVSLWIIAAGGLLLILGVPFSHNLSIADRVFGISIGVGVVVLSRATGGKIGMGDGYLLCVTGICLGFWGNLELFAIALLAAAIVSIFLLVFRLADRKKSIPFIPFLFLSHLIFLAESRPWIVGG